MTAAAECPDDNTLTAFVERTLSERLHATIAEHIDACAECLAAICAAAAFDDANAGKWDPNAEIARGAIIARYTVLSMVGQGAMGSVYAAYDPRLDRRVALKVVRGGGVVPPETRARLLREARVMARVSDPGVVAVHDAGEVDGRVFVAMELLDGKTLREWLRDGPRPWREVLRVFVAAGRGLAAAHAAGVVHRDFKPDNVLIDAGGRVAVTDFGLADSANEDRGHGSGALVGTPAYMSPEQYARGESDARTDQFSFAVALYEALYGERPFEGETMEALRGAVLRGEIRMKPAAGTRVPLRIRRALLKALATDASGRYPTMHALLADLDDQRVRYRWRLAAATFVAAMLAIAFFGIRSDPSAVCRGSARKLEGIWDDARQRAIHDAFRAAGPLLAEDAWRAVRAAVDTYAASWVATRTEACEATSVRHEQSSELLDRRVACLSDRLRDLRALSDLLVHADRDVVRHAPAAAESLASLAPCSDFKRLTARVKPPDSAQLAASVESLRERLAGLKAMYDTDQYFRALPLAARASEDAALTGYRAVEGEAFLSYGLLQMAVDDLDGADESFRRAGHAADAAGDDRTRAIALGGLMFVTGNRGRSGSELRAAGDALLEKLAGDDDVDARLHVSYGVMALHGDKDPVRALAEFGHALSVREKLCGACLQVAAILSHIADADVDFGDYDAAVIADERALAIYRQSIGVENMEGAYALDSIGAARLEQLRPAEAEASFRQALAIWEKVLEPGPDLHFLADGLDHLGRALLEEGELTEAIAVYERALELRTKSLPADETGMSATLVGLGRARLGRGEARLALAALERAATLRLAGKGETGSVEGAGDAMMALAEALVATGGDVERARALAEKARDAANGRSPRDARERVHIDAWLASHRGR